MRLSLALYVAASGCASQSATSHSRQNTAAPVRHVGTGPRPQFEWPIDGGVVSSGFGMRHGVMHDGVDIAAPVGTPVHAAAAGRVIYAGRVRGYGNIVIVQHANHYVTVYAHNSTNKVIVGQDVSRGQVISRVGTTGHTTGPNLHFEVRRNNVASNPLAYLPRPETSIGPRFAGGQ